MRGFVVVRPSLVWTMVPAVAALVAGLAAGWVLLGASSGWFAFVVVWWPMAWGGMTSRVVQVRLPESYHRLRDWERTGRVYERLGVGVAKTILRRGPLARFNPDLHLPADRSPDRLAHLAGRMRDAEATHAVLFVATCVYAVPAALLGWWLAAVLAMAFGLAMNGYPVMLQRYNRARLAARYDLVGA